LKILEKSRNLANTSIGKIDIQKPTQLQYKRFLPRWKGISSRYNLLEADFSFLGFFSKISSKNPKKIGFFDKKKSEIHEKKV
jgi:hypothetical protein